MPRSVTKMCWPLFGNASGNALFGSASVNAPRNAPGNVLGNAPGDVSGDARGGGKAAESAGGAEAAPICTITVPVALMSGQDVLLTVTLLVLPLKKPLTQVWPQPAAARQRSSTAGKTFRRTDAAVSVAQVRCILWPYFRDRNKDSTSRIYRVGLTLP